MRTIYAVLIGCGLLASALAAQAQENTKTDRVVAALEEEMRGGRGELMFYLRGAGNALGWANSQLKVQRGQRQLYCQPDQLSLNASAYAKIAIEEYRVNKLKYAAIDEYPLDALALALLHGLQRTYPCT
jgi:hypothetical protein